MSARRTNGPGLSGSGPDAIRSPPMTTWGRLPLGLLLLGLTVGASTGAEPPPKRVLIVHSFGSTAPPFTTHSTAFQITLTRELGRRVDMDEVSLDMARYAQPDMEGPFRRVPARASREVATRSGGTDRIAGWPLRAEISGPSLSRDASHLHGHGPAHAASRRVPEQRHLRRRVVRPRGPGRGHSAAGARHEPHRRRDRGLPARAVLDDDLSKGVRALPRTAYASPGSTTCRSTSCCSGWPRCLRALSSSSPCSSAMRRA